MEPAGFEQELKHACTVICGNSAWTAWMYSKNQSFRVSSSEIISTPLEERAFTAQLIHTLSENSSADISRHALFQLPGIKAIVNSPDITTSAIPLNQWSILVALDKSTAHLHPVLQRFIPERMKDWELRQRLSLLINKQSERISALEQHSAQLQLNWQTQLETIIQNQVKKYPALQITWSDDVTQLFQQNIHVKDIEKQLDEAIELYLYLNSGCTNLHLEREHLLPLQRTASEPLIHPALSQLQRAELLLEKYEEAAKKVLRKGITVTGKAIAEHLQPSISPPAITDALQKNRKYIGILLQQHPEKWGLLRQFLKPVKELHERHLFSSQNSR